MIKKLKEWWSKFKASFLFPFLKTTAVAVCAIALVVIVGFVSLGVSDITHAPKGFEQYIGKKVLVAWRQGIPVVFPRLAMLEPIKK